MDEIWADYLSTPYKRWSERSQECALTRYTKYLEDKPRDSTVHVVIPLFHLISLFYQCSPLVTDCVGYAALAKVNRDTATQYRF
jgi:hypothetical protein